MNTRNREKEKQGEKNTLDTDFLRIIASNDISCPINDLGWKRFVGDNHCVECIVYPGDHYFHVENIDAEKTMAQDVARGILRKLGVFGVLHY
jgi:hypothetical protein